MFVWLICIAYGYVTCNFKFKLKSHHQIYDTFQRVTMSGLLVEILDSSASIFDRELKLLYLNLMMYVAIIKFNRCLCPLL